MVTEWSPPQWIRAYGILFRSWPARDAKSIARPCPKAPLSSSGSKLSAYLKSGPVNAIQYWR